MNEIDAMTLAWCQAMKSRGHTRPNPPVGAVVVRNGRIAGAGRHVRCGAAHAEVAALEAAGNARGAEVFCTLEPCSKPGRVGACCDALIAAGVKRVVWACPDPNPKNRGRAARRLRAAGIDTVCWANLPGADERNALARAIWRTTLRYFAKHVKTGLPWVTVKLAMSLDGRIADDAGAARWISGPESRAETATWRVGADAVLVGAETVRRDDPSLLCHVKRNDDLWRAVVSKSGRLPKNARIFTDAAKDRTLVYRDAREAVEDLGRRGFMHVLCEGGFGLARSLAAEDLVDEWTTIVAPLVIGARPLAEARRYALEGSERRGDDVFVTVARKTRPFS